MQLIQQDLMKQEADVPIVRKDHKVWLEHFNEFMDIYQYQSASEALRRTFLLIVARILPRSSSRSLAFRFDGLLCECICLCLFGIVVYLFAHIHRV